MIETKCLLLLLLTCKPKWEIIRHKWDAIFIINYVRALLWLPLKFIPAY